MVKSYKTLSDLNIPFSLSDKKLSEADKIAKQRYLIPVLDLVNTCTSMAEIASVFRIYYVHSRDIPFMELKYTVEGLELVCHAYCTGNEDISIIKDRISQGFTAGFLKYSRLALVNHILSEKYHIDLQKPTSVYQMKYCSDDVVSFGLTNEAMLALYIQLFLDGYPKMLDSILVIAGEQVSNLENIDFTKQVLYRGKLGFQSLEIDNSQLEKINIQLAYQGEGCPSFQYDYVSLSSSHQFLYPEDEHLSLLQAIELVKLATPYSKDWHRWREKFSCVLDGVEYHVWYRDNILGSRNKYWLELVVYSGQKGSGFPIDKILAKWKLFGS